MQEIPETVKDDIVAHIVEEILNVTLVEIDIDLETSPLTFLNFQIGMMQTFQNCIRRTDIQVVWEKDADHEHHGSARQAQERPEAMLGVGTCRPPLTLAEIVWIVKVTKS